MLHKWVQCPNKKQGHYSFHPNTDMNSSIHNDKIHQNYAFAKSSKTCISQLERKLLLTPCSLKLERRTKIIKFLSLTKRYM